MVVAKILGLSQIQHKYEAIRRIFGGESTRLSILNTVTLLVLDIALGCLASYYLLLKFPNQYDLIIQRVEVLLNVVLELLQWLRGSPAGFKLNDALNALLCRFFSYHLHLWRNYIGIIEPVLVCLLTTVGYVGILGLTVQIALVKDTLSIATFHIHCLYIYATRLFNVQLHTVISLGRLFFGKKWNPLRNRVDSVHLTISETFLSSLAFMIAVFLLPTTLLYYVVFLGLRLPIRLIEYILKATVEVVNSFEIVTLYLLWTNSPVVADDIYLEPKITKMNDGEPLMTFEIRTFSTKKYIQFPNVGSSFKETLSKILKGVVINL